MIIFADHENPHNTHDFKIITAYRDRFKSPRYT